jgi:hypothetical protein
VVTNLPTESDLNTQIERLTAELDRRVARHRRLEPYFRRCRERPPIPPAITEARVENAYRALMGMSETPWGKVVVGSKLDRLEVNGIQSPDKDASDAVWGLWQDNAMDLESKLAHSSALLDGRAHALVWPGPDGTPRISLDDVTQMVVEFEEGSRRLRSGALRRWNDPDGRDYITLYRPDGIWKFQAKAPNDSLPGSWRRRDVPNEPWPLPNPFGVVPAVEIAVNRLLKPGVFPHAAGEFEDVTGLMDRINLLTFIGLVVAIWMGFPLRGVIGDKILKDDDGNPIPPFESRPDSVVQFEDPNAKVFQLDAADRKNLSVFAELTELASATSTPRHYFPMDGAINASHKPSLGEGWEEVLRLGGLMLENPVELSPRASLQWADHESRSLGERADAALKLSQAGVPWEGVADLALNLGQDAITRIQKQQSASPLAKLVAAANGGAPAGAAG